MNLKHYLAKSQNAVEDQNRLRYNGLSWTLYPYKDFLNSREIPHPETDLRILRLYEQAVGSVLATLIAPVAKHIYDATIDLPKNIECIEALDENIHIQVYTPKKYIQRGQKWWAKFYPENYDISNPEFYTELVIRNGGRIRFPLYGEYSMGSRFDEVQLKACKSLIALTDHIANRINNTLSAEALGFLNKEVARKTLQQVSWDADATIVALLGLQVWKKHPQYENPIEYLRAMIDTNQVNIATAATVPNDIGDAGNRHGKWPTDVLSPDGNSINNRYKQSIVQAKKDYWNHNIKHATRRGLCPAVIHSIYDDKGYRYDDTPVNMIARAYVNLLEYYWYKDLS